MNGRIYDPKLGRFLQADPIVQAPKNSQNLNRYSYVLNNPLSYTDPSGYFIKELALFVAAIARVVYTWEDPSAWVYLAVAAENLFNGMGSQQSALPAGATAGAFTNGFTTATSFNTSGVQHGAAQESRNPSEQVRAAIIGGTGSDQTGWKFANGAVMAGFSYVVVASASKAKYVSSRRSDKKFVSDPELTTRGEAMLETLRENAAFREHEVNMFERHPDARYEFGRGGGSHFLKGVVTIDFNDVGTAVRADISQLNADNWVDANAPYSVWARQQEAFENLTIRLSLKRIIIHEVMHGAYTSDYRMFSGTDHRNIIPKVNTFMREQFNSTIPRHPDS